jgi:hypothetical protein
MKPPFYNSLLKERNILIKELGSISFILRGSLRRQGNICGRPECSCKRRKDPKLHGPYDYLSHRYKNKSQTVFLNAKKFTLAKEGIAGYNRAIDIIYRLCEVNFRILRYHYNKL